jgi:DNA (cytosine-5)-methyltransferase 1
VNIPNHYSAKLSKLDLEMAYAVPPGGNWKNIPSTVASQRIKQIRASYEAGEGSRSTYYGRLSPNKPAYTINTYFNRPGNGCHLHYDYEGGQHRVLSHREAARLQSFPDSFIFEGSKTSISKQIGNAVPPLLAFQVAKSIPDRGLVVDLFCGAGGLSLGFKWAGWDFVVGNDIEQSFLNTYIKNIHDNAICGDIRSSEVFEAIVQQVKRKRMKGVPLIVLGGPPCQGFSTAGKKRTMNDDRNQLFNNYVSLLEKINPDMFIFENVTGLQNMDNGNVFAEVKKAFSNRAKFLQEWKLSAENFAVPQRRTRVLLIGSQKDTPKLPTQLTHLPKSDLDKLPIPLAISVSEAISDLPQINPGQDGSMLRYRFAPRNPYQKLMRNCITPEEYINGFNFSSHQTLT